MSSAGLLDCDKPNGGKLAKRLFDKAPVHTELFEVLPCDF